MTEFFRGRKVARQQCVAVAEVVQRLPVVESRVPVHLGELGVEVAAQLRHHAFCDAPRKGRARPAVAEEAIEERQARAARRRRDGVGDGRGDEGVVRRRDEAEEADRRLVEVVDLALQQLLVDVEVQVRRDVVAEPDVAADAVGLHLDQLVVLDLEAGVAVGLELAEREAVRIDALLLWDRRPVGRERLVRNETAEIGQDAGVVDELALDVRNDDELGLALGGNAAGERIGDGAVVVHPRHLVRQDLGVVVPEQGHVHVATVACEVAADGQVTALALTIVSIRKPTGLLTALDPHEGLLQDDVDHAGDGVRAVDRRSAARDHLNPVDQRGRYGAEIDGKARGVGRDVPFAIDQRQRARHAQVPQVGEAQAAEIPEAVDVGAHRSLHAHRREGGDDLTQVRRSGVQDDLLGHDGDRNRLIEVRLRNARTGDDHRRSLRVRACLRPGVAGGCEGKQHAAGEQRRLANRHWDVPPAPWSNCSVARTGCIGRPATYSAG